MLRFIQVHYGRVLLTTFLVLSLGSAFAANRNFYPIPVWSLFSESVPLSEGRNYFILRGVTRDGMEIDIPAVSITNGLSGRNHMNVAYVIGNASLRIDSPHPRNVPLADQIVMAERPGLLIADLLRGWGDAFNARLPAGSSSRLNTIRLDEYRWAGGTYDSFHEFVQRHEVKL
jgi:hypothetical protein